MTTAAETVAAALARMTPGEWQHFASCEVTAADPAGEYDIALVCLTYDGTEYRHDDAAGIVTLRNLAPQLLADLAAANERAVKAEAEVARLREALLPFSRIIDKQSCKITMVWQDGDYRSTYADVLEPRHFSAARAALGGGHDA